MLLLVNIVNAMIVLKIVNAQVRFTLYFFLTNQHDIIWQNKTMLMHLNWESTSTKINHIFNIVKNIKDEYASKFTTSKLIIYNDKIPTNNIIKSKLHSPPLKDAWITLPSPLKLKYTFYSLNIFFMLKFMLPSLIRCLNYKPLP